MPQNAFRGVPGKREYDTIFILFHRELTVGIRVINNLSKNRKCLFSKFSQLILIHFNCWRTRQLRNFNVPDLDLFWINLLFLRVLSFHSLSYFIDIFFHRWWSFDLRNYTRGMHLNMMLFWSYIAFLHRHIDIGLTVRLVDHATGLQKILEVFLIFFKFIKVLLFGFQFLIFSAWKCFAQLLPIRQWGMFKIFFLLPIFWKILYFLSIFLIEFSRALNQRGFLWWTIF